MASRKDSFVRNISTENLSATVFPEFPDFESRNQEDPNPEIEQSEIVYVVPFEEVNQFRIHTHSYVRSLGGLTTVPLLPITRARRKNP